MGWIKTTDRLPPDGEIVLTYAPDESERVWLRYHEVDDYSDDEWFDADGWSVDVVTHWQPRPEPPEGE